MKKYVQIMKGTVAEYMEYRLSFVLWRFRVVIQLLVTYFLWTAILGQRSSMFGYTQAMMLTYVFLTLVVRPLVMGTRTQEIADLIVNGRLSNFLLLPVHFQRYWFSRDIADKLLNACFAVAELAILFLVLAPPLFLQSNALILLLAACAVGIGMLLFFFFSSILSYLGFWTQETWSMRFLMFVMMEFFAGMLFPLDILPAQVFAVSQSLPFFYFIYFPIKVYLGQLSPVALVSGFLIGAGWVVVFWYLAVLIWRRGLRIYTAEGK